MKIERVTFGKTIGMPNYGNDRPGVEYAILEDGETMEQALTELNQRIIEWHKKEYPHLYTNVFNVDAIDKRIKELDKIDPKVRIENELESLRKLLANIDYQEDAINLIERSGFKFNIELKEIAKSKPNKK